MRYICTSIVAILASVSATAADTYTISTDGMAFEPATLDVQPGDIITFEIGPYHTATSGSDCSSDELFNYGSGTHTWTVPDSVAGTTIDYFCVPHCSMGMTGMINVAGSGGPNTMALISVSSSARSFNWTADASVSGDSFLLDSDIAQPYQIAIEVEGSWDIDVTTATNVFVYTVGSGTVPLTTGTFTLGDGYHIIYNETNNSSSLEFDLPGPAMMGSDSEPLWNGIYTYGAHVEWKMVDGALIHRIMGNYSHSQMLAMLNQPSGTGEIEVSYIGGTSCSTLTLPAELEEAVVSVPEGLHEFNQGVSANPWTLTVSIGGETEPAPCAEDVNKDGQVDISDLLQVISAWGPCP